MLGRLISLEGIDGAGKSMLAQSLSHYFKQQGKRVVLTKEPGGTSLGVTLRSLLQEQKEALSACTEFLLFAADRAQHMQAIIIPALKRGDIVISDRMADSSIAYQGYGKSLDVPLLSAINAWAMNDIQPHLTLYLRLEYEIAYERCIARNERITAFEQRGKEYMQRVITGYDKLAQDFPLRIHSIDAAQNPQEVFEQALQLINAIV